MSKAFRGVSHFTIVISIYPGGSFTMVLNQKAVGHREQQQAEVVSYR